MQRSCSVSEIDLKKSSTTARIHPTAVVAKTAELAKGVQVGAYSVIGPHVRLGKDTHVSHHAVIEGRTTIKNNEDTWEYSLGGEIRAEDVLPNNTVLSQNVSNMRLVKREEGHVRDGYRRGWFLQWLDKYQPF